MRTVPERRGFQGARRMGHAAGVDSVEGAALEGRRVPVALPADVKRESAHASESERSKLRCVVPGRPLRAPCE